VSRVFIAEIAEFGDVINAVNRLRNSETKNIFREQRGLGFISPKQPAIQVAEEKIEREPKQGCIGKGDDKSTAPERIDYGSRRFMMRWAHGSSTSGRRSLGRVASRRDCLCRELDTDRVTFHITFADDEHGVDFHLLGAARFAVDFVDGKIDIGTNLVPAVRCRSYFSRLKRNPSFLAP
jgi:hypothetical protein